jgi:hypothetical protein
MLPRDRAELIVAEYAAGKPVRVIAEAYGHSITTVQDCAHGRRTPGEPAARPTTSPRSPLTAGCGWPTTRTCGPRPLLAELSGLGLDGSRATFYHALERYGIQTHPCPGCHPASMSGYSPLAAARSPQPSPLPVPAAPAAGEAWRHSSAASPQPTDQPRCPAGNGQSGHRGRHGLNNEDSSPQVRVTDRAIFVVTGQSHHRDS